MREEKRLQVFENKVLRKIFEAKRDEIIRESRKLNNTELHALYSSPNINRHGRAGHTAHMEQYGNVCIVLVERPEEKYL